MSSPSPLACQQVAEVPRAETAQRWLVESLWGAQAVGFIAGPPKVGKSWLVVDLAVSVASGTCALGRFAVPQPGPVVMFPAEDGPSAIRTRVEGLALARGLDLKALSLFIVTAEKLKLDDPLDRQQLEGLLEERRPKLLVLDPLVRLHSGDENHAGHVSEVLGYLRALQRRFEVAIIVTHHVSKKAHAHPGQGLRGSGDLHAWGDSNLYLQRRKDGTVEAALEHRFAPSGEPLLLRLVGAQGEAARLEVIDADAESEQGGPAGERIPAAPSLRTRVLELLRAAEKPLSQVAIRGQLKVRNKELTAVLHQLRSEQLVESLGRMGGGRAARETR